MKKAYIQPEAELLTLSSLEDFLTASTGEDTPGEWGDENVGGGGNDYADEWLVVTR